MKMIGVVRKATAMLAVVVCSAGLAFAQDCFDDPDSCAGPRSWSEDFDEDPLDVSPDDWQPRNGELPFYENGKAILDGSLAAWTLIDSAEHFFEGETWIHMVMDANPAAGPDNGAGWWVNADNEGSDGGFYAINAVLARNDDGDQEFRFGPGNVTDEFIPVAEGGVDVTVTLAPAGNDEMNVTYSVTDVNETFAGEFSIVGRDGPAVVNDDKWFTLFANGDGQGIIDSIEVYNQLDPPVGGGPQKLWAGDADEDLDFDQFDLIKVQVAATYLSGAAATWGDGDWDGAPGGEQGTPPPGNGLFDQLDIIAALGPGHYLTGPYPAIRAAGTEGDGQTSVVYDVSTGEVGVDTPAGVELTSINIESTAGVFTGDPAQNLGGSFDNDADDNIFKATFGSQFGSLSFGNVAQTGLSQEFVANDLTVVGSLAGGGDLGDVDLIYVPEPSGLLLLALGLIAGLAGRRQSR